MKKSKGRYIKYIITFLVPIVCMLVHMALKGCYPFGDKTILVGDANSQYWLFARQLIEKLKNGESILFSWHGGMGYEFYQNFWYYIGSPFNIIAIIIGMWKLEAGLVASMLIQVGMCGATMLYYLCHTARNQTSWGRSKLAFCVMLSFAYAMCDYMLAYQYNYIWLVSLIMAPLVMLGVEQLVWRPDKRLYIAVLTVAFLTNFYFAWFVCILSFVWYVDCCRGGLKEVAAGTLKYILCSVNAAMLAGFVLVPCYAAVLGREYLMLGTESLSTWTFGNISDFLQGFLWGGSIDTTGKLLFTNNNYVGIVVIILLAVYLTNEKIARVSRLKRLAEILLLALGANWVVGSYIFHGFTYPNMMCNRQAFILSMLLIVSAYEAVINLERINQRACVVAGVGAAAMIAVALFGNTNMESALCYLGSILIAAYAVICMVRSHRNRVGKAELFVRLAVLGIAELVTNHYLVNSDSYDTAVEVDGEARQWADRYDSIDTYGGERKTSWVLAQNNTAYSDTNLFSSVLSRSVWRLYDSLGLVYQPNGGSFAYRGTTPVTAALFNVRYVLSDTDAYYGGYEKTDTFDVYDSDQSTYKECKIYETEYTCGLGFMVDENILDWDIENDNPFEVQNEFTETVAGGGAVFEPVSTDSVQIVTSGMEVLQQDGLSVRYMNNLDSDDYYSFVAYVYTADSDMHLYTYTEDASQSICAMSVSDEADSDSASGDDTILVDINSYLCPGNMLDVGDLKKGQTVTLIVYNNTSPGDYSIANAMFYTYSDDGMRQALSNLRDSQYVVSDMTDTCVSGTVNAQTGGLLYTSIPYYRGAYGGV